MEPALASSQLVARRHLATRPFGQQVAIPRRTLRLRAAPVALLPGEPHPRKSPAPPKAAPAFTQPTTSSATQLLEMSWKLKPAQQHHPADQHSAVAELASRWHAAAVAPVEASTSLEQLAYLESLESLVSGLDDFAEEQGHRLVDVLDVNLVDLTVRRGPGQLGPLLA